jgi:D-alanyl-D-alanine dipeptidase
MPVKGAGGRGTMVLFDCREIMNVEVQGINESFVDLNGIHKRIVVDNSRRDIAHDSEVFCNTSRYFCCCRESVAERLLRAVLYLPDAVSFYVKEAYRPLSSQKRSFDYVYEKYKKLYGNLGKDELYKKACGYVAPAAVAPHPTGGAVDLVLINENGAELKMGTAYNDEPAAVNYKTYTGSSLLTGDERHNRNILTGSLEKAGFVNYPAEWWHWSYGDRYWAFIKGTSALYDQVDEREIAESLRGFA